jgi:hypothetical protein
MALVQMKPSADALKYYVKFRLISI